MNLFKKDNIITIKMSRNYKLHVGACCNKLPAFLMRANELNINTKILLYFIIGLLLVVC